MIRTGVAALLAAAVLIVPKLLSSTWVSTVYKPIARRVGGGIALVTGLVPFSVAELLIYQAIVGVLAYIIITIIRIIRKRDSAWGLFRMFSKLALTAASLLFIFNVLWGLTYYSRPLAQELGLDVQKYSLNALYLTASEYVEELNALADSVPRNEAGIFTIESFSDAANDAADGWENLVKTTPAFKGAIFSRPKFVLASKGMSYTGITGIFIPFTYEPNVNSAVPDSGLPFTMSHELAHAAGVGPEKEANFAAFLACRENSNPQFRYSGYLAAFIYTYNALVKDDKSAAADLWYSLDECVLIDLQARSEYWKKHEGNIKTTATNINNTYLMVMAQPEGVKSYGMVVDLLIADYVSRNGNPDVV